MTAATKHTAAVRFHRSDGSTDTREVESRLVYIPIPPKTPWTVDNNPAPHEEPGQWAKVEVLVDGEVVQTIDWPGTGDEFGQIAVSIPIPADEQMAKRHADLLVKYVKSWLPEGASVTAFQGLPGSMVGNLGPDYPKDLYEIRVEWPELNDGRTMAAISRLSSVLLEDDLRVAKMIVRKDILRYSMQLAKKEGVAWPKDWPTAEWASEQTAKGR